MSRALLLVFALLVLILGIGYLVYRISDKHQARQHERRMKREERDYDQLMSQLESEKNNSDNDRGRP